MVNSFKTKAGFYYIQFFKIATDDNPFYTHWYRQPGDLTDPCGHMDLPVHYAVQFLQHIMVKLSKCILWNC